MSGIEIVGLVLGAAPIVIWGLGHYKTTRDIWRLSRRKALLVDRLIEAVEEQRILIEVELKLLLRHAGFEDEIAALDPSNCCELLKDQGLTGAIAQHLGRLYEPYQKALKRCQSSLVDIARALDGLTAEVQVQQVDSEFLGQLIEVRSSEWRRTVKTIKFALKKDELKEKIAALDASTKMLSKLRVSGDLMNDEDIQPSSSRAIARLAKFLNNVQRYTCSLYSAISAGYSTGCHPVHRTNLYLDDRSAPWIRRRALLTFRVELASIAASTSTNTWHHALVDVLEDEQREAPLPQSSLIEPVQRPRVTIDLAAPSGTERDRVENICMALGNASQANQGLKLYLSEHGNFTSCHCPLLPVLGGCVSSPGSEMISLERILQDTSYSGNLQKRWSLMRRMVLAYRLASSLLQFRTTPWLGRSWTKQEIHFSSTQPSDTNVNAALYFDTDHPFITRDFSADPGLDLADPPSAKQSLLDLGILLLEVWHTTPFEAYAASESLLLDDSYGLRYEAARKWLVDTAEDMVPFYSEPVRRCIEATFATSHSTLQWNDIQFQKSICEHVLRPLWKNCHSETE